MVTRCICSCLCRWDGMMRFCATVAQVFLMSKPPQPGLLYTLFNFRLCLARWISTARHSTPSSVWGILDLGTEWSPWQGWPIPWFLIGLATRRDTLRNGPCLPLDFPIRLPWSMTMSMSFNCIIVWRMSFLSKKTLSFHCWIPWLWPSYYHEIVTSVSHVTSIVSKLDEQIRSMIYHPMQ